MRWSILAICCIFFLMTCSNNPAELNGQSVCDCFNPTWPGSETVDSNNVVVVIEIYDYQQQLIKYIEFSEPLQSRLGMITMIDDNRRIPGTIAYLWDGTDMSGNSVPGNMYLGKVTLFSRGKVTTGCSECFSP